MTTKALIQRINRKLKPNLRVLKTTRGNGCLRVNFGRYYVFDIRRNCVIEDHVDLATWPKVHELS
jgi:hypothetical protein